VLVHRFDVATLGNAERTPQGFLRIPAYLTRVGVLEYRRADGTVVRELRPRDEVFKTDSLATLSAAPVTDLHPTQMVTPKNVRELQIGHVSEQVRADGRLVAGYVTVQEEGAIAAVQAGKRRELSCGYACRIDATPGVYEGEAYDQVQRDITYNHVAIGPKGWGRAGRDVALRVDAADGGKGEGESDVFRLDAADALSVAIGATRDDGEDKMEMVTIRVDGVDAHADKQSAQLIEKAIATRDDALAEAVTERDALQGKFDQSEADNKKLKAALAEATDPKRLDAAVAARSALIEQARRVLPETHKYDGQSERQIHEAVLVHLDPAFDPKPRSDEYIGARFDHAMSDRTDSRRPASNLDDARRQTGGSPQKRQAARADNSDRPAAVPDWQKPLSYTKARSQVVSR
jgi:uncharacterized protein